MDLYKFKNYTYTTNDLFFDKPCEVMGVPLYPIKVKDYEEYLTYATYLIFSKKHLGIEKIKELDLLNVLIVQMAKAKDSEQTVLLEVCRLFSMLTHRNITWRISFENGYEFIDDEQTLIINKDNFNRIRTTVLKMTLLKEPKIFERETDKKWYEKALKAREKNNPNLELGEIVLVVSQDMKYTIEQVLDMNIFQLYSYYTRIGQIYECETTRLFATVSDKVKMSPFAKKIFEDLYKDHDKDLDIKGDTFTKFLN